MTRCSQVSMGTAVLLFSMQVRKMPQTMSYMHMSGR